MMTNPERPQSNQVSLEELLRLKRAERPDPEFWSTFERDLRAKQLAAIIEPRPWWISWRLPQVMRLVSRFQMPAGALAVLALSFVVVREYSPYKPSVEAVAIPVGPQAMEAYALTVQGASPSSTEVESAIEPIAAIESDSVSPDVVVAPDRPTSAAGSLTQMIPWADTQPAMSVAKTEPSSTFAPAHFAPSLTLNGSSVFQNETKGNFHASVKNQTETRTVEPEHRPSISKHELRRNLILASYVPGDTSDSEGESLAETREQIASSLDDDQLYDSVRRLGMGGDRLTLKF